MSAAPSVSVVVPAYRQAAFIGDCLDSIALQQHASLEVVVVDDGCPEGTGDVAERHPTAPKVVRQPNGGAAAARNRGIEECQGELIAFLDADDRWCAGKLARQLSAHERAPGPALSFTRYRRVDVAGEPCEPSLHPAIGQPTSAGDLLASNFVGCSTVLVHRACLERVGGFPDDEALRRGGQDYALWLRVAAFFPLLYVREVLTLYTVHADNRVGTDAVKHFEGWAHAVRSLSTWDGARFRALCDGSPRTLVNQRARELLGDVVRSPRQYRRAWGAYREALRLLS